MRVAQASVQILPKIYSAVRATGVLNLRIMQEIFVGSYFLYKGLLEDSFDALIRRYPEILLHGHVFDIGANIGYTASVFARHIPVGGKIFAFEPDPSNFQILKRIVRRKGFEGTVFPVQAAVGEKPGTIEFWENHSHHADHRVITDAFRHQVGKGAVTRVVPLTTIDAWSAANCPVDPVSLIKIDVQGYEPAVCKGMVRTLERNPGVSVAFEYMPSVFTEMGFDPEEVLLFFRERGMNLYVIENNGTLTPLSNEVLSGALKRRGYVDILASLRKWV